MHVRRVSALCATVGVVASLSACAQRASMLPAADRGVPPAVRREAAPPPAPNLIKDGSFEKPLVAPGSYQLFLTCQTFSAWTVSSDPGNVGVVSGTFTQNGFTFPAACGQQWLDLTGVTQTATGVAQTIDTVPNAQYSLSFEVGNVYDPNGIFGTFSIVNVFIGTKKIIVAKNTRGRTSRQMVWKRFTTSFTASGATTTIDFLNGDPSTDTLDGLDCIEVRQL